MTPQYVVDGDSLRCLRHGVRFDPAHGACAECEGDPGDVVEQEETQPPPPEGCLSSLQLEQLVTAELEDIRACARRLAKPPEKVALVPAAGTGKTRKTPAPSRVHMSTAAKLWDTWLKGVRVAREIIARREDEEIVRERERRDAEREGGRAH